MRGWRLLCQGIAVGNGVQCFPTYWEGDWLLAEAVGALEASLRDGVGEHPHNAAVVTRTRADRAARLDMSSSLGTSRVFILVGLRLMGEE